MASTSMMIIIICNIFVTLTKPMWNGWKYRKIRRYISQHSFQYSIILQLCLWIATSHVSEENVSISRETILIWQSLSVHNFSYELVDSSCCLSKSSTWSCHHFYFLLLIWFIRLHFVLLQPEKQKLNLPSSVFASGVEEKVGLLNKAAPQSGKVGTNNIILFL